VGGCIAVAGRDILLVALTGASSGEGAEVDGLVDPILLVALAGVSFAFWAAVEVIDSGPFADSDTAS